MSNIKKNKIWYIFIFIFVALFISTNGVDAKIEDGVSKQDVEDFFSALGSNNISEKTVCNYNLTAQKSDQTNIKVYIIKLKKSLFGYDVDEYIAYASTHNVNNQTGIVNPGDEPILNWKYNDEFWDDDLGPEFSALEYYKENKGNMENGCPKAVYLHIVDKPFYWEQEVYLVNELKDLPKIIETFDYTNNLKIEPLYLLAVEDNKTVTMECEYTGFRDWSVSFGKESFILQYNSDGRILNAYDFDKNPNFSLSREMIAAGDEFKDTEQICKTLHLCEGSFAKMTIYYADYATDNRTKCPKEFQTNCSNTEKSECTGEDVYFCPTYSALYKNLQALAKAYNNCNTNDCNKMGILAQYNATKNTLKNWCNMVLKRQNSYDICLLQCLEFGKENLIIGSSGQCGFSDNLIGFVLNIMKWIKYIIPAILIILSILDFIKAMGSDKDDEMKKAQSRFIKRLIAAALIFIIPLIIEFVLDNMGFAEHIRGCGIIEF